ncbi:MAG: lamin tail domain-containing protein [Bacteroidales bacterium]
MKNHILLFLLVFSPLFLFSQTVSFDFEDSSLSDWVQYPDLRWEVSTDNPISGVSSLKHALLEGAGSDRITIPLPSSFDGELGSLTWRFKVRHRFNPSGSNNWAVFLSSSTDATEMVSGGLVNGYAIGVNQTGTDDILRIYKVTNGSFVPLLTTDVNWESVVGSRINSIAAIEVERKPGGDFLLKLSANGDFASLQTLGSVTDNDFSVGPFFGLCFNYTTSAAGKFTADNISINYKPVNTNDHFGDVVEPVQQVDDGRISSMAITPELAVEVFRFVISDQGSTDNLPIKVSKLRFSKVDTVGDADWPQVIGGAKITTGGEDIAIENVHISSNTIEIDVLENSMMVPNNGSGEFSLWIYLNPEGIADGQKICLSVLREGHGWETNFEGSDFKTTFSADFVSSLFTIEVIPTHLSFFEYPNPLVVNKPFRVVAHAADERGNLASSFSGGNIVLASMGEEGDLLPETRLMSVATNGVIEWNDVFYSQVGEIWLTASTPEEPLLQPAQSEAISVINDTTSLICAPNEQVSTRTISSTLNTVGKAVEIFRFGIADQGNFDRKPTYVNQLFIKRPSGLNSASYSSSISGIVLRVNGEIVPTGSPHILTASISIPIPSGALVVSDGDTLEVSLSIYLRNGKLPDGQILRFMVDANDHRFIADGEGSSFASSFSESVISEAFVIDVMATRLEFTSIPEFVGFENFFSVEVSAVDEAGSVDIDAKADVSLYKNLGDGWLSIPLETVPLDGGKAIFSELEYSYFTPVPFNLLASSTKFNDVISPLIYCSDRDSEVLQPPSGLQDGPISSLAVSANDAVEVLRFRLADKGTTDKLPTQITQMVFQSQQQQSDADLARMVSGVVLIVGEEEVVPESIMISRNSITLGFGNTGLVVPDLSEVNASLKVYLNKGGLVDGSTVSLHIPATGHGWKTALTGSGFPSNLATAIIGPTITLNTVGTHLAFIQQPFVASMNEDFGVRVALTDIFGNISAESGAEVTLTMLSGPSNSTFTPLVKSINSGLAIWNNIKLNALGEYVFKVSSTNGTLNGGNSQPVWIGKSVNKLYDEDFEKVALVFSLNKHWSKSTVNPINGKASLQHALVGVGGQSQLPIPLTIDNLGNSPVEWSFVMRNGDWDPTSDNAFWFVLASDSEDIASGQYNGYAVGVNVSGSSDLLSLWRFTQGQTPKLLIQSDFDWNESETVTVKVTRAPNGEWSLFYKPKFDAESTIFSGSATDISHSQVLYCGPVFKYTSTRAGEFWLDDLLLKIAEYPPVIQTARLLTQTSVNVVFSGDVNSNDALIPSNYVIKNAKGSKFEILGAYANAEIANSITLRTQTLSLEPLTLYVSGVKSVAETTSVNDSIKIGMGAAGTFGNVIINEIMARPSGNLGLPNVEYIELYNRTEKTIDLSGWKIRANDKSTTIENAVVETGGYLILSSVNGALSLQEQGNTVGVTSFPSLLVGGMFLGLYDENGNLISWVEYSDSWYGNDAKKTGGYSLERIDVNNLVEGSANWTASSDAIGGTPGRVNSVNATNADNTNPWVTEIKVVGTNRIEVGFSEPMDSLSISLAGNYLVSRGLGNPTWSTTFGPKYNRALLTFETEMVIGEVYSLCFEPTITDFAGNLLETPCVDFALHEEPAKGDLIINEVLFNPYTGGTDFVEIYNNSDKSFDLSKLWIANRDKESLGLKEYYPASDRAYTLFPGEYVVLTDNPLLVEQFYYIENPNAMVKLSKMPSYPSDKGYVLLLSELSVEIDELAYTDKMHNALLADVKGVSLERIHPDMPSASSSSWQSAAQTAGFATPTAQNSQFSLPTKVNDAFNLSQKVFSPDGDGFEDYVLINYELPESGFIANIMVFDSRGRRIKRLAANLSLGTSGSIKWDGTTDGGDRATLGAYVIFIEAFDLKGSIKRYKKTVVVATKFR